MKFLTSRFLRITYLTYATYDDSRRIGSFRVPLLSALDNILVNLQKVKCKQSQKEKSPNSLLIGSITLEPCTQFTLKLTTVGTVRLSLEPFPRANKTTKEIVKFKYANLKADIWMH